MSRLDDERSAEATRRKDAEVETETGRPPEQARNITGNPGNPDSTTPRDVRDDRPHAQPRE